MIKIPLIGKGEELDLFAVIDDEDVDLISSYRWFLTYGGGNLVKYATAPIRIEVGKWSKLTMHRLIMNAKKGELVDHINHDGLDNRKENLRICTSSENGRNRRLGKNSRSGFKGVSKKKSGKYEAAIRLGTFILPEDAAKEYDRVAKFVFGEFANLS